MFDVGQTAYECDQHSQDDDRAQRQGTLRRHQTSCAQTEAARQRSSFVFTAISDRYSAHISLAWVTVSFHKDVRPVKIPPLSEDFSATGLILRKFGKM